MYKPLAASIIFPIIPVFEKKNTIGDPLSAPGERLYSYPRDARIKPVVTIVLSTGPWDGPRSLRDMVDLDGIPGKLESFIGDYGLNIIEIPNLDAETTSTFKTDLKQVMDAERPHRPHDIISRKAVVAGISQTGARSSSVAVVPGAGVRIRRSRNSVPAASASRKKCFPKDSRPSEPVFFRFLTYLHAAIIFNGVLF